MRLHLADLLLRKGDAEAAREHFDWVLQKEPANIAALQGAAAVASRLGDEEKAAAYNKLLSALGGQAASTFDSSNVTQFSRSGRQEAEERKQDDES